MLNFTRNNNYAFQQWSDKMPFICKPGLVQMSLTIPKLLAAAILDV